ncbi:M50 family metallopeptidase [Naasia sp. SYSU D00057]|uniref:M50 family metallopeptidase n=1 Tax=Naasia sp. SYSU D00057 TaxID=2817380 RepID=UPI001B30633E|nr:M50 family metallopeptidase [Naasia sp. SYSU D00057]
MEQLADLWARVTAPSPALDALPLWVALAVAVLAVLPPVWRHSRHAVTIVHEAGHGFAATVTGRRLSGIRLHSDTSGVTVSVGRPRGPGMALTLLAGYPAPALVGLGTAWLTGIGHAAAALWALLLLVVLVLVQIRNWFGLWSVLVAGAAVFAVTWWAPTAWHGFAATAVSAFLLLGGVRTVGELQSARRREGRGRRGTTDADQLSRVAGLPGIAWVGLFLLLALACTASGGALLLRLPLALPAA